MSHGTARRFLFVLVFHSSLANIAGWNAVSAQETVRDNPPPAATNEAKSPDAAVRGLAALRAEAEAELRKYHSENQQKLIVRLYREIVRHPENDGKELITDLGNVFGVMSSADDEFWDEGVQL